MTYSIVRRALKVLDGLGPQVLEGIIVTNDATRFRSILLDSHSGMRQLRERHTIVCHILGVQNIRVNVHILQAIGVSLMNL